MKNGLLGTSLGFMSLQMPVSFSGKFELINKYQLKSKHVFITKTL